MKGLSSLTVSLIFILLSILSIFGIYLTYKKTIHLENPDLERFFRNGDKFRVLEAIGDNNNYIVKVVYFGSEPLEINNLYFQNQNNKLVKPYLIRKKGCIKNDQVYTNSLCLFYINSSKKLNYLMPVYVINNKNLTGFGAVVEFRNIKNKNYFKLNIYNNSIYYSGFMYIEPKYFDIPIFCNYSLDKKENKSFYCESFNLEYLNAGNHSLDIYIIYSDGIYHDTYYFTIKYPWEDYYSNKRLIYEFNINPAENRTILLFLNKSFLQYLSTYKNLSVYYVYNRKYLLEKPAYFWLDYHFYNLSKIPIFVRIPKINEKNLTILVYLNSHADYFNISKTFDLFDDFDDYNISDDWYISIWPVDNSSAEIIYGNSYIDFYDKSADNSGGLYLKTLKTFDYDSFYEGAGITYTKNIIDLDAAFFSTNTTDAGFHWYLEVPADTGNGLFFSYKIFGLNTFNFGNTPINAYEYLHLFSYYDGITKKNLGMYFADNGNFNDSIIYTNFTNAVIPETYRLVFSISPASNETALRIDYVYFANAFDNVSLLSSYFEEKQ